MKAVVVGLGELAVLLQGEDEGGELGHGVGALGEGVENVLDVRGDGGSSPQVLGNTLDLGIRGDLASEEEPEEAFGEGLAVRLCLRKLGLELRDGVASEADALIGIEERGLPEETCDAPHATKSHVHRGFA